VDAQKRQEQMRLLPYASDILTALCNFA